MLYQNQIGMRCRATREIRTHEGPIRRFTEVTIQAVIDNLGRQLINVKWDSGITTYVFFKEIEITDGAQLFCRALLAIWSNPLRCLSWA